MAEEFTQYAEQAESARNKISLADAIMQLGYGDDAARIVRSIFAEVRRPHIGDELGKLVRILMLCEGVKVAEEILALTGQSYEDLSWPHQQKALMAVADHLAQAGGLSAATKLWLELLTDTSVSITANFHACSSIVESGQRELAIASLHDALRADDLSAPARARSAPVVGGDS